LAITKLSKWALKGGLTNLKAQETGRSIIPPSVLLLIVLQPGGSGNRLSSALVANLAHCWATAPFLPRRLTNGLLLYDRMLPCGKLQEPIHDIFTSQGLNDIWPAEKICCF
jgi:hypothetical protein